MLIMIFDSLLFLTAAFFTLFFSFLFLFLACRKFLNNKMLLVKRNDINKGKTLLSWGWGWGWGRTWLTSHIHKLAPATIATAVGPVARNFLPHLVDWHLMVSWCGSWGCFACNLWPVVVVVVAACRAKHQTSVKRPMANKLKVSPPIWRQHRSFSANHPLLTPESPSLCCCYQAGQMWLGLTN